MHSMPRLPILRLLAACLLAQGLAACGQIQGVSSVNATNLGGAPGTANDLATGGQGGRTDSGGGGGGGGRN